MADTCREIDIQGSRYSPYRVVKKLTDASWETVVGRNTFFSRPIIHDSVKLLSRTFGFDRFSSQYRSSYDCELSERIVFDVPERKNGKRCRNVGRSNLQGCKGKQYLREVSDL